MPDLASMTVDDLLSELGDCFGWDDRYRYLIELGKSLPKLDANQMNESTKVIGCQSNAWMVADARTDNGTTRLYFKADSDTFIVKGLIAVVVVVYSGKTPKEILEFDIEALFDKLDLRKHLSPVRGNGLLAMVKKIKSMAEQYV